MIGKYTATASNSLSRRLTSMMDAEDGDEENIRNAEDSSCKDFKRQRGSFSVSIASIIPERMRRAL